MAKDMGGLFGNGAVCTQAWTVFLDLLRSHKRPEAQA